MPMLESIISIMHKIKLKHPEISWLLGLAVINLIMHLLTNGQFGFHRDELYMIDCAKHLDFGYADMPPLTPWLARLSISLFGESLRGLRLFPAIASSVIVLITGVMAKEMGGRLFSQLLAALAIMLSPVYLVSGTQFQTIPFDQFFWVIISYLLIRLIRTDNQRLWLLIGLFAGLGLMNKYSVLFLGLAVLIGLIASCRASLLSSRWIWPGIFIACMVFLPNIIWQIGHHFPVLDHMKALREDESIPALRFLTEQGLIIHPLTIPIWLAGILFFCFHDKGRKYYMLVWIYIIPLFIFLIMKGKSYYLSPSYPVLLAGGSVAFEIILEKRQINWPKYVFTGLLVATAIITIAWWLPVLSVKNTIRYGIMSVRYDYREMIGWEDLVKTVSQVYNDLPSSERSQTTIITGNYGEAGAINHYGTAYGLPAAVSGISSYHYWGPGNENAKTFIVVGMPKDFLSRFFLGITLEATLYNPYGIKNEEQGQPVFLCRDPVKPINELWRYFKYY
jgi:hypothetical protein